MKEFMLISFNTSLSLHLTWAETAARTNAGKGAGGTG